jgi:sortase B
MFGSMKNVLDHDWYSKADNHIIKLSSEKNETKWKIFSIYRIKTTNDYLQTSFNNNNEFQSFLDLTSKRSTYKFDVNLKTTDKILTLSTCYNETEKVVLHAKLILDT